MNNSDCLFIDALEVACRIGTTDEERAFPQLIWISIRAFLPLDNAAKSDDLTASADYAAVEAAVRRLASTRVYNLAEAVAHMAADEALRHKKVRAVWVRVEKRVLSGTRAVGVEIYREQK